MRHLVWLVTLLSLLATNAEAAEPAGDEAKAHVRRATAAYNLGKYAEAAQEYEAAYELTLDANMLFNVGQSYRLSGQTDKAITAYRSFIRTAPKSDQRGLAEAKLRDLEQQRTEGQTTIPSPVPGAPTPAQLPVQPAAPMFNPGRAPSGPDPTSINAITSTAAPPAPPPTGSHFYQRWPFWTGVGVVVAGGAALAIILSSQHDGLSMPTAKLGTKEY